MLHPDGGFYSALDADSEGVEGKFYTWTMDEFKHAIGKDFAEAAIYFGVTAQGNWEHGRNILMEKNPGSEPRASEWKSLLLKAREPRVRPGLDDKVLAGWNAMTVVGLVDAYGALDDRRLLDMATRCLKFIETRMMESTHLFRTFKNKRGEAKAFLEDYAWLIKAYVAMYQATFEEVWLQKASKLCEKVVEEFWDPTENYFHYTSKEAEKLIARKKEVFDNVIPASNSVMARNLYQLGTMLDNESWKKMAERMAAKLAMLVAKEPTHMSNWGILLIEIIQGLREVAIVGPEHLKIKSELRKQFLPLAVLMGTKEKSTLPLLADKTTIGGKTGIYVCFNKTCQRPVTTADEALAQITNESSSGIQQTNI
jgi:hypothetical protein